MRSFVLITYTYWLYIKTSQIHYWLVMRIMIEVKSIGTSVSISLSLTIFMDTNNSE